jgi:hypothetical protein
LTIFGLLLTATIAAAGFRSFGRWRAEKLEERRIDIALETLTIMYEVSRHFEGITQPFGGTHISVVLYGARASTLVATRQEVFSNILKSAEAAEEFFAALLKVQLRYAAAFENEQSAAQQVLWQMGREIDHEEDSFDLIKEAFWRVYGAAQIMAGEMTEDKPPQPIEEPLEEGDRRLSKLPEEILYNFLTFGSALADPNALTYEDSEETKLAAWLSDWDEIVRGASDDLGKAQHRIRKVCGAVFHRPRFGLSWWVIFRFRMGVCLKQCERAIESFQWDFQRVAQDQRDKLERWLRKLIGRHESAREDEDGGVTSDDPLGFETFEEFQRRVLGEGQGKYSRQLKQFKRRKE